MRVLAPRRHPTRQVSAASAGRVRRWCTCRITRATTTPPLMATSARLNVAGYQLIPTQSVTAVRQSIYQVAHRTTEDHGQGQALTSAVGPRQPTEDGERGDGGNDHHNKGVLGSQAERGAGVGYVTQLHYRPGGC